MIQQNGHQLAWQIWLGYQAEIYAPKALPLQKTIFRVVELSIIWSLGWMSLKKKCLGPELFQTLKFYLHRLYYLFIPNPKLQNSKYFKIWNFLECQGDALKNDIWNQNKDTQP